MSLWIDPRNGNNAFDGLTPTTPKQKFINDGNGPGIDSIVTAQTVFMYPGVYRFSVHGQPNAFSVFRSHVPLHEYTVTFLNDNSEAVMFTGGGERHNVCGITFIGNGAQLANYSKQHAYIHCVFKDIGNASSFFTNPSGQRGAFFGCVFDGCFGSVGYIQKHTTGTGGGFFAQNTVLNHDITSAHSTSLVRVLDVDTAPDKKFGNNIFKNVFNGGAPGTTRIWFLDDIAAFPSGIVNGNVYFDSIPGGGGVATLDEHSFVTNGSVTHANLASAQAAGIDKEAKIFDPQFVDELKGLYLPLAGGNLDRGGAFGSIPGAPGLGLVGNGLSVNRNTAKWNAMVFSQANAVIDGNGDIAHDGTAGAVVGCTPDPLDLGEDKNIIYQRIEDEEDFPGSSNDFNIADVLDDVGKTNELRHADTEGNTLAAGFTEEILGRGRSDFVANGGLGEFVPFTDRWIQPRLTTRVN